MFPRLSIVITIAVCFIFMYQSASATNGTAIEGNIVSKNTGKPVFMANIFLEGTSIGTISDKKGSFVMLNVPPGSHEVIVTMMGYKPEVKKVTVREKGRITINFELEEALIEMGSIVVSGTRTPRYIKDAPIRTEVITCEAIEERAADNLLEALGGSPGIRVEQQCSYCNFSVLRMQGLESGHVQMLVDGQPLLSGLAGVYGLQQIPAGMIERIEVVKGAGSALYGSSAIAGAVNIITKNPAAAPSVKASIRAGTNNTNSYNLTASTTMADNDIILTAQKNTGDEIDENGDGLTDRVKTDNIALGFTTNWYDVTGNDKLTFTGRTLNEFRQGGDLARWDNPFAEGSEQIRTTRYEGMIGYARDFHRGDGYHLNLAYSRHRRDATNDSFLGDYMDTHEGKYPPVSEMQPYLADENLYSIDTRYTHIFLGKHRLLGGVACSRNELGESGRYVIVDDTDPDYGGSYTSKGNKRADDVGLYAQGEFHLTGSLELVAGVRYDHHHSEDNYGGSGKVAPDNKIRVEYDEDAVNPRFAVKYKLSSLAFRGSAGTGFRVPFLFSEDLHLCSGSPRVNKPAGLEPEKSRSYAMGVDYSREKLSVSMNVFLTELIDKIGFVDAGEESKKLGYTYEWSNIDDACTRGMELGVRALLHRDVILDLNGTYTDARYEHDREDWARSHPEYADESRYIPRVPVVSGNIKLEYGPGTWNVVLDANYTGRMYIDYYQDDDIASTGSRIVHTPDFWVYNSKLSRKFPETGITAFVGAKNLFNYVQEEKHPDDAAFMYAPYYGRIVYLGMEIGL